MPYIAPRRRQALDGDGFYRRPNVNRPNSVGELTYLLTKELNLYLVDKVQRGGGIRYADAAECLAALEGARADFERRILTELEIGAQERSGDVWSDEVLAALRERA